MPYLEKLLNLWRFSDEGDRFFALYSYDMIFLYLFTLFYFRRKYLYIFIHYRSKGRFFFVAHIQKKHYICSVFDTFLSRSKQKPADLLSVVCWEHFFCCIIEIIIIFAKNNKQWKT